jgi:transposase
MLYYDIREIMPSKKVSYKKKNQYVYVYYTKRAYRNKHGKPTSEEISIGKLDKKSNKLIPNDNYFTIYQDRRFLLSQLPTKSITITEPEKVTIHQIRSCAIPVTLFEVAKQIKLLDVLVKCFPADWEVLLTVVFYIVDHSSTMMHIGDWHDETKIDLVEYIDDFMCSKLFASITAEERQLFFHKWMSYRCEQECIVYDVSSISTYSKNIESAEYGYNRDGEQLPQLNLAMFYGASSKLPVYYDLYSGSIPDKSCLEYMMANAKDIGIEQVCFVFDQGFVTEGNLACMYDNQYSFITALPMSRKDSWSIIEKIHGNIEKIENWITDHRVYGVQQATTLYGHKLQAHIYFDNDRKTMQMYEHYSHIEKLRHELEKMSKVKQVPKRYKDYFLIEEQPKKPFTYEIDHEKANDRLKKMGYFILLSTNPNLNSNEVLDIYRGKDGVEKHFDQFKNGLEFKRLKTHYQNTSEGKVFVGFLALILRSHILKTIKNDSDTKDLTFDQVMLELRKIKAVMMSNGKEIIKPLTSKQKIILATLKIGIDKIVD